MPARQASLLEPEQEDDLEAARPRAQQVEHRHAARLAAVVAADRRALERAEDLLRGQRPAEREPALELAGEAANRLERAKVGARGVVDRRRVEPVRVREHRAAVARSPSSGVAASRSSFTIGNGFPCSASVSASTRSCALIARPRRRPSRKSTFGRATPEYGVRRNP